MNGLLPSQVTMTMSKSTLLLLLMTSSTQLLICFGRSVPKDSAADKYAIVFDAGSSKTKMEIYKLKMASPPLDVTDVEALDPSPSRVEPGIASLAENPDGVELYLAPLLTAAKNVIPRGAQKSADVFFFATAGMRLLPPDQSGAILREVEKLLSDKSKCPFTFYSKNAKIISGTFEGIYAWISVNFLQGNLLPGGSHNTSGILDMGGASHQNAFNTPTKDTLALKLGNYVYHLFSRSYLGYGLNEAIKKYVHEIFLKKGAVNVIESPCHLEGYEEETTISGHIVKIEGKPSVPLCRSIIKEIFFCKNPGCPFYDQPRLQGDFVGISGMFYTALDIGLLCYSCVKPLSPVMFDENSRQFCANRYQDVSSNPYAKVDCFRGNYVYELLSQGYDLPPDKTIEVGKKMGGFNLGWTLGAMIYNGEYL